MLRAKRCVDLLLGGCAVIVLAPLMALVGLIVRLDSPGPVLFAQRRIGRGGVPFTIWKFRSMYQESGDGFHRQQSLPVTFRSVELAFSSRCLLRFGIDSTL